MYAAHMTLIVFTKNINVSIMRKTQVYKTAARKQAKVLIILILPSD